MQFLTLRLLMDTQRKRGDGGGVIDGLSKAACRTPGGNAFCIFRRSASCPSMSPAGFGRFLFPRTRNVGIPEPAALPAQTSSTSTCKLTRGVGLCDSIASSTEQSSNFVNSVSSKASWRSRSQRSLALSHSSTLSRRLSSKLDDVSGAPNGFRMNIVLRGKAATTSFSRSAIASSKSSEPPKCSSMPSSISLVSSSLSKHHFA
mmetsp:Transcript_59385/g.117672  ORF Transcript_59385/g.117672 Transcript_59385/m.117672 type:complete len:203 (-) Transcript_59385:4293-4901(-)